MLYLVLIALAALALGFGGWTWYSREDAVNDYKARLEQAEGQIAERAALMKQQANDHITDMEAAYEVGEAEARAAAQGRAAKGASDVAKYPVFSNRECVLPDYSLRNLNDARAGLRSAAAAEPPDVAVRGTSSAQGRPDRNPLPTNAR